MARWPDGATIQFAHDPSSHPNSLQAARRADIWPQGRRGVRRRPVHLPRIQRALRPALGRAAQARACKGPVVAYLSFNCHRLLEAYFAVPQLGAILLPLNIRLSAEELAYILNDAAPSFLFFDPEFTPLIECLGRAQNPLTISSPCAPALTALNPTGRSRNSTTNSWPPQNRAN